MDCIADAEDVVEAIKSMADREVPGDSDEAATPAGDEEGEGEVVALARRCLDCLGMGHRTLAEG